VTEQLERALPPLGLDDAGAVLGHDPIPLEPYYSQEWFELERDKVFTRTWLMLGRVEEIPNPGDYMVRTIEIAKASVLVTRAADGVIRAFHNVCGHRGSVLARTEGCGHARRLVCGYHSWAYDMTGKLAAVPAEEKFQNFDKADHGLTPIACDIWEGFIFINLDPSPRETLREHMGELYGLYSGFFDGFVPVAGHSAVVKCNRKALLDAFMETYHFASIHTRTLPDMAGRVVGARLYDRHRVLTTAMNPEHVPTPAEMLAYKHGHGINSAAGSTKPRPPGLNTQGFPTWQSDITVLFPNVDVQIIGDFVLVMWFWPLDPNTTRFIARYYMAPPSNAGARLTSHYLTSLLRDVFREDLLNIEYVQAGIESGGKTHMVIQANEVGIRHANAVMAREIGR
jgi:phenylpropionate dioxygenase-like ring-hydroxylating dioxygenase large terminal subunit